MTGATTPQADITVAVLAEMLLIDAGDDLLRQSLADVLPGSPPGYELGFAFMIPVDKAWGYLEPLVDAGLTIEQVEP